MSNEQRETKPGILSYQPLEDDNMDHLICADRYYATTQAVTEAIELSEQSGEIVHIETRRSFDDIHSELFESCDDFADNGDVSEFWGESEDEEGESRPWRVHLDRA